MNSDWWLMAVPAAIAAVWLLVPGGRVRVLRTTVGQGTARLSKWQRRFGSRPDAPARWVRLVAGAATALLIWSVCNATAGGAVAGGVFGVVAVAALGRVEGAQSKRERAALSEQLPSTLELMASGLDAGLPLRGALSAVSEVCPEPTASLLHSVSAQTQIGRSDADAWGWLRAHPVWGDAARDLARSADSGAAVAHVLRVHAAEARRRHWAALEVRARAVGVKSVLPLMTCFLPAFILLGVVPIVASGLGEHLGRLG